MDEPTRSFRLHRSSSSSWLQKAAIAGRSKSSRLLLESVVSSEFAELPSYQRLSQSMRLPLPDDEPEPTTRKQAHRTWGLLTRAFTFSFKRKEDNNAHHYERQQETNRFKREEKRKKSSSSSWLPNPNRRWPIQGW